VLLAGLVELDGQLVAVDGGDVAVAEFLVEDAVPRVKVEMVPVDLATSSPSMSGGAAGIARPISRAGGTAPLALPLKGRGKQCRHRRPAHSKGVELLRGTDHGARLAPVSPPKLGGETFRCARKERYALGEGCDNGARRQRARIGALASDSTPMCPARKRLNVWRKMCPTQLKS
jgi:hypothetical protein